MHILDSLTDVFDIQHVACRELIELGSSIIPRDAKICWVLVGLGDRQARDSGWSDAAPQYRHRNFCEFVCCHSNFGSSIGRGCVQGLLAHVTHQVYANMASSTH